MRKLFALLSFISAVFFLPHAAVAQRSSGNFEEDGEDDPYDTKSYFMFGLNFLSDNVSMGRKDTVAVPYLTPYIGYHHKSGLYAKLSASDAPTKSRVDLLTLEAGYEHSFSEHLNTGLSAEKYFYNKNSTSIRGNAKGSAGLFVQYTNDWVEPQINANLDFYKKTDYSIGLMLDHDFTILDNTLHIVPQAIVNAGTQNFYNEYFVNRVTKKDKTFKKDVLAEAGKFKVLDYELSVKATYRIGKWLFTAIPTYVIPVNALTINFPKQTFSEKLTNSFFVELDICHR